MENKFFFHRIYKSSCSIAVKRWSLKPQVLGSNPGRSTNKSIMNSNNLEIERRFLLKYVPDIKYDRKLSITQYYMKAGYRLRSQTDKKYNEILFYKTFKEATDNPMVDKELDNIISAKEFNKLYKKENVLRSISKERYIKYLNNDGLKIEIDNFNEIYLVIAEVELPTIDYDLILPDYIQDVLLLEVTEFRQFKNYNLAK